MDSCKYCRYISILINDVFYNRYYQTVPGELPELPKQQVFGLATPEDFSLPPIHPMWTEEVYTAFDVPEGKDKPSQEGATGGGGSGGATYDSKVITKHLLNYTIYASLPSLSPNSLQLLMMR